MKKSIFLLLFALFCTIMANPQEPGANKPNIIYILADDLGYGDIGCYGQTKFKTPNIDKLASDGIKFTQHYSGSTVCAPSRSVLLSGQHTGHTFIRGNKELSPEGQYPMDASVVTVAEILKDEGYVTGAFGKWGLGAPGTAGDPNNQGFDNFFGYNCQRLAHNYYPYHLWDNQEKVILENNAGSATGTYAPNLIHQKALEFIETNKNDPFFLYLPTPLPHAELLVPERHIAKYRGKLDPEHKYIGVDSGPGFRNGGYGSQSECHAAFAGMIDLIDEQVGQIVAKLEELDLSENTIIIFTSDNGPPMEGGAQPNFFNSNGDLRGYKRDLYEGGVRVPLIASWPNKIAPGTTTDHISAFWDFLPTVADIAGATKPNNVDGISFLPTLINQGTQAQHEYLYWEFHEGGGKQAVRMGYWKGIKLNVMNKPDGQWLLYNLDSDISESTNIAGQNPDVIAQLNTILKSVRTPSPVFPFVETVNGGEFDEDPSAQYPFNNNAYDVSGNGWNASEDGITFINDDAGRGAVAEFKNTYSLITGNKGWKGAEARSITSWIKTATPNRLILAAGTKAASQKFCFLINNDGTLRVEAEGGFIYGTTVLTDGKWHHVACTFEDDGTPDVTDVKLYVDGEQEAVSAQKSVAINTKYGIDVTIGKDFNRTDRNFVGRMDDLQLWTKSLSNTEIAQLAEMATVIAHKPVVHPATIITEHKKIHITNPGKPLGVTIYDLRGLLIQQENLAEHQTKTIEVNHSGVYICQLQSSDHVLSKKIYVY